MFRVVSNTPLASRKKMLPLPSERETGPPEPQMAPSLPFGVTLRTLVCLRFEASVGHHPSGVRTDVAVRSPGEVKRTGGEEQAGALFVLRRIEDDLSAGTVVAGAGILRGDLDRAFIEFGAGGGVERVQVAGDSCRSYPSRWRS